MRRLLFSSLLLLASLASAQDLRRSPGDWTAYTEKACIGGTCRERRLRVALEDRPVIAVRFRAHDQIGEKAGGTLRVKIDGNTVRDYIDVPRRGEVFTVEVDELRGRYLVFEPANDDEVEVSEIAVLYGRDTMRRVPRDRDWDRDRDPGRGRDGRGAGGWKAYPRAGMCIGGDDCRKNGTRITIALDDAPVLGIRFFAQDAIGERADGRLSVRIDDTSISSYVDIQRAGKRHEFDVENVYGTKLVIETANDDEVEVKDIEVLYGNRGYRGEGRGGDRWQREVTDEGGCIGGGECGGRRARIRIPLYGRPVDSIRLYARDDVGTRAAGELRIRIDDEILEYSLDIPREGRTFTVDGKNIAGDYLFIEPAADDEVVIRDIRVRFRQSD